MNKSAILIVLIVLIALGVGGFFLMRDDNGNDTKSPTQNTPAANTNTNSNNQPVETDGVTITYSDNGFNPSSLSVKSGSNITVKNTSSSTLEFSSDPHPVHTTNSELNADAIAAGESKTFKVTKTGSWGFHNHLRSNHTGTLVVE